jgi:S-layer family protein
MKASAFVFCALSLAARAAGAADGSVTGTAPLTAVVIGDPQDTYGTASLTAYEVGSYEFEPRSAATPLSGGSGVERFFTSAAAFATATPTLPNGAQVERIELRACDTDAGAQVTLNFGSCPNPGGTCPIAGTVSTGTAATPGCNNFSTTLATPVIVNTAAQVLSADVTTGATAATTFSAVKLYYRLRISAAPATATFPSDVPTTHPFFRFVEALAAAGITGGCGTGSYCPDAPVTRGQMAVFLATALGLHFPN